MSDRLSLSLVMRSASARVAMALGATVLGACALVATILVATLLVATLLVANPASSQDAPATPPVAPAESRITAEIRTNSDRGVVFCALFSSPRGFPREAATRSIANQRLRPSGRKVICTFSVPGPGTYAVSAFHDENSNGELDTGMFGIPSEGWGTSRNAPASMGPPSWTDARFNYRGGAIRLRDVIRLNY